MGVPDLVRGHRSWRRVVASGGVAVVAVLAALGGATSAAALDACTAGTGVMCTFGGFEIDGNTVSDGNTDWTSSAVTGSGDLTNFYDLFNTTSDDIMSNGSKESSQSTWSCVTSKAPGKADLGGSSYSTGQFAPSGGKAWAGSIWFTNTDPGHADNVQYLYGNFQRYATNGDVHIDYEFNKASTLLGSGCTSLPVRSQNDVLITFDTSNGGAQIFVSAFVWNCTGTVSTGDPCPAGGSFKLVNEQGTNTALQVGVDFAGTANISPAGSDTGVTAGAFGEAGLNLTSTVGNLTCGQFGETYMKTRSAGTSDIANGKAEVKDFTTPVSFNPGLCPTSMVAKYQKDEGTDAAGTDETGATDNTADQSGTFNQDCSAAQNTAGTCASGATATPMSVNPGDEVVYKLVYKNTGGGSAPTPVVQDTIPANTTYVAGSQTCPTSANCFAASASTYVAATPCASTNAGAGQTVTNLVWCLPAEAPTGAGAGVALYFEVDIPTSSSSSGTVTYSNCASVSDNSQDTGGNSNCVAASATFAPTSNLAKYQADLQSVTVACNTASLGSDSSAACIELPGTATAIADATWSQNAIGDAHAGDLVGYKLTYDNSGDSNATNVVVTDTIPSGSAYVASSCSNLCTTTGTNPVTKLTWSLGTVQPGAAHDVSVTFEVRLNATFPAWDGNGSAPTANQVKNKGSVTSTDETTAIDSNIVEADVIATPNLGVVKTAGAAFTGTGTGVGGNGCTTGKTCVTYSIAYYNTGSGSVTGQTLTDVLPSGVTFVSASNSGANNSGTVTWTVDVGAGTSSSSPAGTVTVTVQLN